MPGLTRRASRRRGQICSWGSGRGIQCGFIAAMSNQMRWGRTGQSQPMSLGRAGGSGWARLTFHQPSCKGMLAAQCLYRAQHGPLQPKPPSLRIWGAFCHQTAVSQDGLWDVLSRVACIPDHEPSAFLQPNRKFPTVLLSLWPWACRKIPPVLILRAQIPNLTLTL